MLGYALKALKARKGRTIAIAVGFALSFASVIFSNAIASNLQLSSSAALRFVVGDKTIWMTPPGSPKIDPVVRTMVQDGALPNFMDEKLAGLENSAVRTITLERRTFKGSDFIVYWDSDAKGKPAISNGLAAILRDHPLDLAGYKLSSVNVDSNIPGIAAVLPFQSEGRPGRVTWILVKRKDAKDWALDFAAPNHFRITDSTAGNGQASDNGTIFLLSGSLSRIDPFTFQTKFAALQLNAVTSSLLGWLARIVFIAGAILVITSSRISVMERRPEVAALTALGYQTEFTILLLIENAILLLAALPVSIVVGLLLSASVLPGESLGDSFVSAVGLTVFFAPVVLILSGLWSAQYVASKSEVSLVRSEY